MEENSSPSQLLGGQSVAGVTNRQNLEDSNQRIQYSIPGILHFIQHEWARFEMERSRWELERAELQAKIAFLNGERKGQENLKNDLVRRIKMLEFALKQERAKYHKLKYGTELVQQDMNPPMPPVDEESGISDDVIRLEADALLSTNTNASWKHSRQLLRQYLQEIGYTDTIIDLRSNRVRSLLGLTAGDSENNQNVPTVNGSDVTKKPLEQTARWNGPKKMFDGFRSAALDAQVRDAEKAIMDNFDFLSREADMDVDEDEDEDDQEDEEDITRLKGPKVSKGLDIDVDGETVDVLDNEFRYLNSEMEEGPGGMRFPPGSRRPFVVGPSGEEDAYEGLGELAQLSVSIDADNSYETQATKESARKTWAAKYNLRSHFDCVRGLCFNPTEATLITASEDATLKLWNLQKTIPAKKSAILDVEPVYTFRGHTGPVLCLAVNTEGDKCFSGGKDGSIRVWNVPPANIDPYSSYDHSVMRSNLTGHSDAVWGLVYHNHHHQLLSCSADSTIRLWSCDSRNPLLFTYSLEKGSCIIFDLESGKPVTRLEIEVEQGGNAISRQINKVLSHPTLPMTITAHEDRHIRFWDNNTGRLIQSMVAHLESVTSLAVDPNGLYLLSGSHDCSIRLWQLDSKQCVQEITAHRKKFDESIFDVAFHPSKSYIASAGADAMAKVYV